MRQFNFFRFAIQTALVVAAAGGCSSRSESDPARGDHQDEAMAPTNRIAIPASVRQNLGITFAIVERRAVANTIRVPGRFEWLPTARREYRTPGSLEGRVELLVEQYQPIEPGTPLYRLDSPQWRQMQREIEETQTALDIAQARLESLTAVVAAHELHEQGLREAVELWTQRVAQLEEVVVSGGGRASDLAQARAALNESRSAFGEVLEKHAELQLREAEVKSEQRAAGSRFDLLIQSAASILGKESTEITAPITAGSDTIPLWKATNHVEVRAGAGGIVETLPVTHGAWVDRSALIVSVIDPTALRFRAVGLQSDLPHFRAGLDVVIVPHRLDAGSLANSIPGKLELGLVADPDQRTLDLMVTPATLTDWSRAGVSAFLEITLDQSPQIELAIPLSCVIRDGLKPIIFRRDPADANKVIKVNADVGINDGRWVVIQSGVREGDEIVLDGVYQLMLATSGTVQRGGHFHSDGTFHADEH